MKMWNWFHLSCWMQLLYFTDREVWVVLHKRTALEGGPHKGSEENCAWDILSPV
jgi:hypothetical protein